MFRCDSCSRVVPAGTREAKIVTETRDKVYEARGSRERERFRRGRRPEAGKKARRRQAFDKGGRGTEIVREIAVCPACALEHRNAQAAAAAAAEPVLA